MQLPSARQSRAGEPLSPAGPLDEQGALAGKGVLAWGTRYAYPPRKRLIYISRLRRKLDGSRWRIVHLQRLGLSAGSQFMTEAGSLRGRLLPRPGADALAILDAWPHGSAYWMHGAHAIP